MSLGYDSAAPILQDLPGDVLGPALSGPPRWMTWSLAVVYAVAGLLAVVSVLRGDWRSAFQAAAAGYAVAAAILLADSRDRSLTGVARGIPTAFLAAAALSAVAHAAFG